MSSTVAKFKDVSEGTQPGQFTVGDHEPVTSLADLEPSFRRLLDEPVTAVVAVLGADGQPNLTPVWFDYEGDTVLLNLATHRKKVDWLRRAPHATFLLMNAGRAAKTDAARRLAAAATAAPGRLAPQQVVATARACAPPETIATVDAGAHMLVAMPLWDVAHPKMLLTSSGLATMGYALPAEIAAALCLSLRVIVIVFNDAALSLIEIKQNPAGHGGEEAVRYRPTSFAAAAAAMGAAGAAVSSERELAAALTDALARPGPTVIDAHVDPAGYPAVMDLSRGQAGRRSVPGISRANQVNQVNQVKERVQ